MDNIYTKYRQRLASQMQTNPELNLMNKTIAGLSSPFQEMNNQLQSVLQQTNASAGARVAATVRGQQQLQDERQGMYSKAVDAMSARTTQLTDKFAEVSMKEAELAEQQKIEKSEKRTGAMRTGLKIAGMVIGGALAAPTGGMSLMAGLSIGGGLGQMAGGAMGIDKQGNLSMDASQFDPEAIITGAATAVGSYVGHLNETKLNEMSKTIADKLSDPNTVKAVNEMSPAAIGLLRGQLESAVLRGDQETVDSLLSQFNSVTPDATVTAPDVSVPQVKRSITPTEIFKAFDQTPAPTSVVTPATTTSTAPTQAVAPTYDDGNPISAPKGTHTVAKGGQFSKGNKGLVVKVNGVYRTVYQNGKPIPVKVGQQVIVNPDGTIEVK